MASCSGTNAKSKKESDYVSPIYNELESLISKRNKLLRSDDDIGETHLDDDCDDVDFTEILKIIPETKPNARLLRNEEVIHAFSTDVAEVQRNSRKEKNYEIDDDPLDDEIDKMLAKLRKDTENVFQKLITVQDRFSECLTNNIIMIPDDIKEKDIKTNTQIVEQTCALHRGIESVIRCTKDTIYQHADKALYVESPEEFVKACSELEQGILSQTYENGVKTSKNHEHLLATQRYNKHSDELTMDIVGERLDPYTKKPITKPVINTICKHVYDQDSIELMFRGKNVARCPYIGCSNKHTTREELKMTSVSEEL